MEQQAPDLTGRKALVLGANDPAAAAIARALAQAGADVAVTSSTGDPEEAFALRPLRRAIEAEGRRAIADIADLGNGSSVQIAVRQVAKQLGRIDLLFIAASETLDKPAARVTDADWSRLVAYNLGAYFYACRAITREFTTNDAMEGVRGRIVALLPAIEPAPGSALLLAARAGAEAMVTALAREWAEDGIVVTAVAPEPHAADAAIVAAALAAATIPAADTGRVVVVPA